MDELEDYDAAIAAYQRCRSLYRDLGRRVWKVRQLYSLAFVYGEAERHDHALAVASEAGQLAADFADPAEQRYATVRLSLALARLGRYDDALDTIGPLTPA